MSKLHILLLGAASITLAAPMLYEAHAAIPEPTPLATSDGKLTLSEWNTLPTDERRLVILAAIEGLMLAAGNNSEQIIDRDCLLINSPQTIDQALVQIEPDLGDQIFVDVFLSLTGCLNTGEVK